MNYVLLKKWVEDKVEELVEFGVPRTEAEEIFHTVEFSAISAYAMAKNEDQFLLDFQRCGSAVLAERQGCSEQAVRKRRTRILKNRNRRLRA